MITQMKRFKICLIGFKLTNQNKVKHLYNYVIKQRTHFIKQEYKFICLTQVWKEYNCTF